MIFIHLFMLFPRQAMEGIPFKGQRVAAETKSTELCCPVLPIELYEHTVSFRFLFYLLEVTRLFPPAQIVSTMKVTAFSAVNTPDNVGGSCLKISQMHFKKKIKSYFIDHGSRRDVCKDYPAHPLPASYRDALVPR